MGAQINNANNRRAETERGILAPTIEFLRRYAPFDRMAGPHLEFLAKHLRLGFYPKGEIIIEPARGGARTLYLIKQGRVRGELASGSTPSANDVWELEAGECFPLGAMLARRPVVMQQRAIEDTFCFELDREPFEKLLALSPTFHDFCSRRLASLYTEALRGMQADLASRPNDVSFDTPVATLARRAPIACAPDTRLRDVVARMHAERIGSMVVVDANAAPLGIFTLHDLLGRVAARDVSLDTAVAQVMTPNPRTLPPQASAHEAMVLMARHAIGHLGIVEHDRLVGVISERDLFSLQRIGLVRLTRDITAAPDIDALARLSHDIHRLIEHLLAQGVAVARLMQIVALLNDHVTRRAIALCVVAHAPVRAAFSWLAFGSEGRHEQTLKTDQDNGMLIVPAPDQSADAARAELLPLARRVNDVLAACGFPLCRGNVMASNPECCLTLEEWRRRFAQWIDHGEPEHLLNASIYFDFRTLDGDPHPAQELRQWMLARVAQVPRFQHQMAQNALRIVPPLGFLRDFEVEPAGAHSHQIDLKLRGATPFVDGARLLALAHGIEETNTLTRLRAAAERSIVPAAEADAWCDAYTFIQLVRMRHHQTQARAHQTLDNHIDPTHLNELDRRVLKEAFRQARKLQAFIALEYQA